jgi:hypothetical protein
MLSYMPNELLTGSACWRARAGVGSGYNCYFGGQTMVNEHLTFPPLPNNTNGNFPSWSGVGGQFDPMWYNSQGVAAAARAMCSSSCSAEHAMRTQATASILMGKL